MDIPDKLHSRLMALPKESLVNLMYAALDEMQLYNGRSVNTVVLITIGARETNHGWVLPSKAEMKRDWE